MSEVVSNQEAQAAARLALLGIAARIVSGELPVYLNTEGDPEPTCRTPACLIGWYNRLARTRFVWGGIRNHDGYGCYGTLPEIAEHFGIDQPTAHWLFGPSERDDISDREEVAIRAERFRSQFQPDGDRNV